MVAVEARRTPGDPPGALDDLGTEVSEWMSLKSRYTAEDKAPLKCVSCGVEDHASTNYAAVADIFERFLDSKRTLGLLETRGLFPKAQYESDFQKIF